MNDNSRGGREGRLAKSVSERFEKAKLEQAQRESQRLESFRLVDNSRNTNNTAKRGSLASRWEEVLSESKDDEKKKFETQKRHTIATFLSAYEAGLVQRRISHYESLFMQISASLEKIQATIRASKRKSLTRESIEPITPSNILQEDVAPCIDFPCGTTQNYHFAPGSPLHLLLSNCLVANSQDPLPLLCGIYGTHDTPFEVVAVAIMSEISDGVGEPCIAITINLLPDAEAVDGLFGPKKIAFFVASGDAADEKTMIWDPLFNILPPFPHSPADPPSPERGNQTFSTKKLAADGSPSPEDPSSAEIGLSTEGDDGKTPAIPSVEDDPVPLSRPSFEIQDSPLLGKHEFDILSTEGDDRTLTHGRGIGNYVSSSDSSIDEGNETWKEVVPETEKRLSSEGDEIGNDPGQATRSIFSLAKAKGMPEVHQFSLISAGAAPQRSNFTDCDVIPWTESEVKSSCGAVDLKSSHLDIHVRDIQSYSCSADSVVFRLKSGASLIVVSSLKFAVSPAHYFVSGEVVFEWVRGVAKSGWLSKWPMKNQKAGMMTRRFFILRDRILSYHRVEPSSQEEASADYSMHSIKLKKGHYVHRSKHHMTSCVKLDTVNDALWVKCRSKEEEDEWIAAIWEGINRYNRPSPFFWKSRLEVVWHHESPAFQCLGVDAVFSEGKYSRAALYCSSLSLSQASPSKRLSRSNTFGQIEGLVPGEDAIYSLEFGVSVDNEVHLEVLSLASAAESPRLLCLKILGDTIMVGGTHGYIGLAIVGAPARYRLEVSSSRKLSESGVCEVISRQYEGHQAEAHVLVIASDEDLSLFVSGDSLGGVALWKQRKRTGTAFIGSLKGRSLGGSRICAIEFTPQKTHLVIGTTKKLLLVGLWGADDGSYRLEGLAELEVNDPQVSCFYSLAFPTGGDHLIVWKVVSETVDCTESMSRASVDGSDLSRTPTSIHRFGLSSQLISSASQNLQPIVRYRDHEETSRMSLADLQKAMSGEVKVDEDSPVKQSSPAHSQESNDKTSPVKSSWRGTAKKQPSWKNR